MDKDERRNERRQRIETAALRVLEDMGYRKTSMLQIARSAKSSNETLYNWYGNKQGLFASIIEANSNVLKTVLEEAIESAKDPGEALLIIGSLLLQFTATEKAVIVNRAAVADVTETGMLAKTIELHARQPMTELLTKLMTRYEDEGYFEFTHGPAFAADIFIRLLLGELQLQQALGAVAPMNQAEITKRSIEVSNAFGKLFTAREK